MGSGTVLIEKLVSNKWQKARIGDVLLVPDIKRNLFSVGVCVKKGYDVTFSGQKVVLTQKGKVQAIGHKQLNDIYRLFFKVIEQSSGNEVNISATNLRKWHERLGYINIGQLKTVLTSDVVKGVKVTDKKDFFCEACQYGKAHRLKFDKKNRN